MENQLVRRQIGGAAVLAWACCCLAGCGGAGGSGVVPVEGKVIYKNQPLTKGSVAFFPDAAKGNTSKNEPRGQIDGDGKYKMMSHPSEGAAPGWYKVTVTATEPSDPKNPYSMPKHLIPEKFGKVETSGLSLEVRKDAAVGAYDLELK